MDTRRPVVPAPLRLPVPLREYLREEAAGGIVLMAAAALALAWANSPWQGGYTGLWETRLAVQLGASPSRPTCATGSTRAS
jgi:NhaA family Na+:H+ antiporter